MEPGDRKDLANGYRPQYPYQPDFPGMLQGDFSHLAGQTFGGMGMAPMGPMGNMNQMGTLGSRGPMNALGAMGPMGQMGMGQMGMGQMGMGQMGPMGPIGQMGQMGQQQMAGAGGFEGGAYAASASASASAQTQAQPQTNSKLAKTKGKRRSKNDTEGRVHKCQQCDRTYLSYPALYTHIKTKHPSSSDMLSSNGRGRGRPKKIVARGGD
jgi:hypothetical protein